MSHRTTAGRLANFNGPCARCDDPIVAGQSQVINRGKGRWIHAECASGADDE